MALVERSPRFKKQYSRLDRISRNRVEETIAQLADNTKLPALRVEKIKGASERIRSCRVTRKIRLIFKRQDSEVVRLLLVGAHDAAYREGQCYFCSFDGLDTIPAEELERPDMLKPPVNDAHTIVAELNELLNSSTTDRQWATRLGQFHKLKSLSRNGFQHPAIQTPGRAIRRYSHTDDCG